VSKGIQQSNQLACPVPSVEQPYTNRDTRTTAYTAVSVHPLLSCCIVTGCHRLPWCKLWHMLGLQHKKQSPSAVCCAGHGSGAYVFRPMQSRPTAQPVQEGPVHSEIVITDQV
jgi:hypothetical protein